MYLQFSVTIGFTSSTATVTFRTASVFAISSPMPDAPKIQEVISIEIIQLCESERTSCDNYNLVTPVEASWCPPDASLVTIKKGVPLEEH